MLLSRQTLRIARKYPKVTGLSNVCFSSKDVPDPIQKLRDDVKYLGTLLGLSIKKHDPEVFEAVEQLRLLGREWRQKDGDIKAFDKMVAEVKTYDAKKLFGISKSFANFLALANSAENHHRVRKLKESLISSDSELGLWPKEDSCAGTIKNLLKKGIKPEDIVKSLSNQKVEIVLTAHPTEVNRRTMLRKHEHIKDLLDKDDNNNVSLYEKKCIKRELSAEISSIWESDELRRSKPTPVVEAKGGLLIVETVLWDAVPNYLRKLEDVVSIECKTSLPLQWAPIKMASWMGGDRDGNPNVTPPITLEVSMLSRWTAAKLFKRDVTLLKESLSMRIGSPELELITNNAREPYRFLLEQVEQRLDATMKWTSSFLDKEHVKYGNDNNNDNNNNNSIPMKNSKDLMDPLLLIHSSLVSTGMADVATGLLTDTIRRVAVFGLSLMPLDIRQESTRHSEAVDAITKHLGIGSYVSWDEKKRRDWLLAELASNRPLLPKKFSYKEANFSPTVIDTLETFDLIASLESDSLGAYVISQCQQASDVLAVMLLQQEAGVKDVLRIVPLFETLDDLERSADTVDALFSSDLYRGRIRSKQEIMVGYSDSAKDAGRLAASWAQYNAQIKMIESANKHGVEVTFFHGKGGTVGRGGNPAVYAAILAHPPQTINGRFRVTEQGEMITQNLGQLTIAERTLDFFTSGVLAEPYLNKPVVKSEWVDAMERLSAVSCNAYRQVVRGEERFVPYFRAATPELELSGLNVGSRPAKRNPKGGVESLRAIPWVFSWTQTRLNLPTWLGVGEALNKELSTNPEVVKDMYQNWSWFRTLIDLLDMILSKSDLKIAENYDKQLVQDSKSIALGNELRNKMTETIKAVLSVSGNTSLQINNNYLLRSLTVRNPYIDPLNIIQAELLLRLRSEETISKLSKEEIQLLQDALLITINGIANGMRNSG